MGLILCHSPKGGVGTTFIAAHLAIQLAARGHEVAAIDFTYQDSLKLFFGLFPTQPLVDMADTQSEAFVVSGVELLSGYALSQNPDFRAGLARPSTPPFGDDKILIADVASDDRVMRDLLMPHAMLHICSLLPRPAALAALAKVDPDIPAVELPKTVFVLNQLDDTQRLSRHTHVFVRELLGERLIGTVRRDEAVNEAMAMFEPMAKFAPASVTTPDLQALATAVEERCALAANVAPYEASERGQ